MMPGSDPLTLDSAMLDEARAYLRIDEDIGDGALGALLLAAINHAEAYIGQLLIQRGVREILSAGPGWQRLRTQPVIAVTLVTGIPAEGASFTLSSTAWQARINAGGEAYLRIIRPGIAGRVEVTLSAGLSPDWVALPEALRLAVLRLASHFDRHRDAADDAGMPDAVAALLHPWRRLRLA